MVEKPDCGTEIFHWSLVIGHWSLVKGQAADDHNGTNVNGRSLLFFRFGIVVQNSFSGFQHKIYEHYIRDDMFLQLSIHFPYILLDNHAY